jgi:hypothetical protein
VLALVTPVQLEDCWLALQILLSQTRSMTSATQSTCFLQHFSNLLPGNIRRGLLFIDISECWFYEPVGLPSKLLHQDRNMYLLLYFIYGVFNDVVNSSDFVA